MVFLRSELWVNVRVAVFFVTGIGLLNKLQTGVAVNFVSADFFGLVRNKSVNCL